MPKFTLDFSLYSAEERLEFVKTLPLETLTKTELETVSNYILYGKDKDGTSCVDRKEIQIKTKFNSYHKNQEQITSLDALLESPTFDESTFVSNPTLYKKLKPSIDRERDKEIPNMIGLWKEIDRLTAIYEENCGKREKQESTPTLTSSQLYYLNHMIIQLRTQQYYLLDSVRPTTFSQRNRTQFHDAPGRDTLVYPVLPRGVIGKKDDEKFKKPFYDKDGRAAAPQNERQILEGSKPFLDFRNEEHLYHLILHYGELEAQADEVVNSPLWNLLWTLDFYIEKANLSPQQSLIVEMKKGRCSNKEIRAALQEKLGIDHRENYISTIWNKAVKKIKDAVELNYDEWLCKDYKKAWKQCSKCGEWFLRDSRNFVKKTKALDGLTGRCKLCDKKMRNGEI